MPRKKAPDVGTVVFVLWHDAETQHGWEDEGGTEVAGGLVESIGYLLHWRKKTGPGPVLVICGDRHHDPQAPETVYPVNRSIGIPWGMVREIRTGDGRTVYPGKAGKRDRA